MCGIIGFSGKQHVALTKKGLGLTSHRGPDERVIKTFHRDNFSFGMNRLAIRDLHKHLYPFSQKNLHLIYNGELYNVDEVKKNSGYQSKTSCDAEIILPLFAQHGLKSFELLTGMFAIAIYDSKSKNLYLARDMFGEKPLYYSVAKDWVGFSSELKVFASHSKKPAAAALKTYLALGYQPHRETIYPNVYKVLPGEVVQISLLNHAVLRFSFTTSHVPLLTKKHQEFQENELASTINHLEDELTTIVTEKIVADVPVGVFLSGGVDSGLLTALMANNLGNSGSLRSYSVAFDHHEYDESPHSRALSQYLGTTHTEIPVSASDIASIWDTVITQLDEPFADPAIFPTYLLSQRAAQDVTVIMSGEGADEFFGGYPRYKKQLLATSMPNIPSWLARMITHHIPFQKITRLVNKPELSYTAAHYNTLWDLGHHYRKQYLAEIDTTWINYNSELPVSRLPIPLRLFLYDLRYYVAEQLCMKVDKMSMLHSIESRAPYLDRRLFPYMAASGHLLKRGYSDKYLLRKVAERYIPHQLAWREKQGFSLPLEYWLRSGLSHQTNQLCKPHALLSQLLPADLISELSTRYLAGTYRDDLSIWNLIIADSWLKLHYP